MNKVTCTLLTVLLTVSAPIMAADHQHEPMTDMKVTGITDQVSAYKTKAEVRKVNLEQGTITLKHGDIRNLDMPAMTMMFPVKDKSQIKSIQKGDQVLFLVERINDEVVVTSIEKQ